VAFCYGIALLFLLPFILPMHRPPMPGFDAEWLAAVLLAITVTLTGIAGGGSRHCSGHTCFRFRLGGARRSALDAWTPGLLLCVHEPCDRGDCMLVSYCVGRWLVMRDLKRAGLGQSVLGWL